jgi:hypothetical protein
MHFHTMCFSVKKCIKDQLGINTVILHILNISLSWIPFKKSIINFQVEGSNRAVSSVQLTETVLQTERWLPAGRALLPPSCNQWDFTAATLLPAEYLACSCESQGTTIIILITGARSPFGALPSPTTPSKFVQLGRILHVPYLCGLGAA